MIKNAHTRRHADRVVSHIALDLLIWSAVSSPIMVCVSKTHTHTHAYTQIDRYALVSVKRYTGDMLDLNLNTHRHTSFFNCSGSKVKILLNKLLGYKSGNLTVIANSSSIDSFNNWLVRSDTNQIVL